VWIAIVFSGGLSTGLAIAIWNTAVKNVGASNTAVYGNLVPFVALLGGMLFLGETVTGYQLVGGGLIIGGVVLVRRHRVRS
jgi:drug/metabolite transporter (DMT)-like permease